MAIRSKDAFSSQELNSRQARSTELVVGWMVRSVDTNLGNIHASRKVWCDMVGQTACSKREDYPVLTVVLKDIYRGERRGNTFSK